MLTWMLFWFHFSVVYGAGWGEYGRCNSELIDELTYCCWEGQAWTGSECVGPPKCPAGWTLSGYTCIQPECWEGRIRVPDGDWGQCCWEGQGYSTALKKCVGIPKSCPKNFTKSDTGCYRTLEQATEVSLIPAGTFVMGCIEGKEDCSKAPKVTITRDFYMMKTEVTNAFYRKVTGSNPRDTKYDNNPIEVHWHDAVAFANQLSQLDGKESCYEINGKNVQWTNDDCKGWRLPTVAEWEYAGKGGENFSHAGSDDYAEVSAGSKRSETEVAQWKANGYGLYDMTGGVKDWCWDKANSDFEYTTDTDPRGASSYSRYYEGKRLTKDDIGDYRFGSDYTHGFRLIRIK